MARPLLLVDAPSMLFRAFYALPESIEGKDGRPVNALLGTANLVLREVEQHGPGRSCCASVRTPPITASSSSTDTTPIVPRSRRDSFPSSRTPAPSSRPSAGPWP